MPTKKRNARLRLEGEREAGELRLFAGTPEWAQSKNKNDFLGSGIAEVEALLPELRLRGGLLTQTADGGIGYAANRMADKRAVSAMRKMEAEDLRKKYSNIWGQRSAAKRIAAEVGLGVRTIQKYIKEFPR